MDHIVLITGPAGSGKTTAAASLAKTYNLPYLEGDLFHPQANIDKMGSGHALTDEDRWEWLARVRDAAVKALKTPADTKGHSGTNGAESQANAGTKASTGHVDPHTTSLTPGRAAAIHPDSAPAAATNGNTHSSGHNAAVVTCSALKKSYRDVIRKANGQGVKVTFIFLSLSEEVLFQRVRARVGHYMKEDMVRSQIEVLEYPDEKERKDDTVIVDATGTMEAVEKEVHQAYERLVDDGDQV